jgi:hypothetical protein
VRLSPDHAQTLFNLVKAEGMSETKVVVAGRTPGGDNAPVARSRLPANETVSSRAPDTAPGYAREPFSQPSYGQSYYGQSGYAQRSYARPSYQGQSYYGQSYYAQPGYAPPSYAPPSYAPQGYAPPGYWQR